jgi:nuclear GTP-binding protein
LLQNDLNAISDIAIGENFYRDAKKASKVKMLNGGKAVRDKDGKIIEAAAFQKGEKDAKPGRVMPDRRWFGESALLCGQTGLTGRRKHSSHFADCS